MSAGSDKDNTSNAADGVDRGCSGPWKAIAVSGERDYGARKPIFDDGVWHIIRADQPDKMPIAIVDRGDDHDPPTRAEAANIARLIAAAPDALAACQALIKGDDLQFAIDLARVAIAKAQPPAKAGEAKQ